MQVQSDMDLPTLRRVRIGGVANASVTLFTMGEAGYDDALENVETGWVRL